MVEENDGDSDWLETLIAVTIVSVVVLIVLGLILGWFDGFWPEEEDPDARYPVPIGHGPTKGSRDAPVLIIEFSDFECPYCTVFATETMDGLQRYIDDGTLLFAYRHFPLRIHPKAAQAAKAASCADEQDLFWGYHDLLYANDEALEIGDLRRYAEEAGLDMEKYDNCFANDASYAPVERDINAGLDYGVTSTPTFFINGRRVVGALPLEEFEKLIAEELALANS